MENNGLRPFFQGLRTGGNRTYLRNHSASRSGIPPILDLAAIIRRLGSESGNSDRDE